MFYERVVTPRRKNRYIDKINIVKNRFGYLSDWSQGKIDSKTRFAIYKVAQEGIEAIVDIVAIVLKDSEIVVKDEYSNFETLSENAILNPEHTNILTEANGLKNRLVHDYNGLDDDIAMQSILDLYPKLLNILEVLKEWIMTSLNE